jgi:putative heme-binding domain-containing protein
VTVKGRPLVERPQIVGASIETLLEMLRAPEEFTRLHARLALKGRGAAEVIPSLDAWAARLDSKDPNFEHLRLEALWTYQALDVPKPELLMALVASDKHQARAAATRVLAAWIDRVPSAIDALARLVEDPHPRVRLEAVRALALVPTAQAAELALRALDHPVDRFLDHALWLAARDLQPYWLPELDRGNFNFAGNLTHLTYALAAAGSPRVVAPLVKLLNEGKLPPERTESVLLLIAALGDGAHLSVVVDRVLDHQASPAGRAALLAALNEAARLRKVRPEGDLAPIVALVDSEDEALRVAAIDAAGLWKLESAAGRLEQLAAAGDTSDAVRRSALASLAALGPRSLEALNALAAGGQPAKTRGMAIAALAALDVKAAANRLMTMLEDDPAADPAPAISAILDRKGGAAAIAEAAGGRELTSDAAKLAIRAVRAAAREEPDVTAALAAAGGVTTPKRALSGAELAAMVAEVRSQGDPARGEAVFRRAAQQCFKCHAIAGAGGRVGPDLVSLGGSAQVDYLIESILDPSAKIKENYHSLTVVADGLITSGVRLRETRTELVLRDAEDREVTIPIDAIEDRKDGGSIMPVGLADELTRAELVDLVRFLSELGKVGPYAAGSAPVARRWQTLVPPPQAAALLSADLDKVAAGGGDGWTWTEAYSKVSGDLPLEAVRAIERREGPPVRVVRCELDVAAAGKAELALRGRVEKLWLDGSPIAPAERVFVELPAGLHAITLLVPGDSGEDVRVELRGDSTVQAQFVGGK